MKTFRKVMTAAMTAVLLLSTAAAVSAGNVYTADQLKRPGTTCAPWETIGGHFWYGSNWNPYTGKYVCSCPTCAASNALKGYYYVNGVYYPAQEYVNNATHDVTPAPSQTAKASDGTTYHQNRIPHAAVKKTTSSTTTTGKDTTGQVFVKDNRIYTENPYLTGCVYNPMLIPGAVYYPASKITLAEYFEKNTVSMYLAVGDKQQMETGYRLVSTDSQTVSVYTDKNNQVISANKVGTTYLYLYSEGGVPMMRIQVAVSNRPYYYKDGMIDIVPDAWRLDGDGSSTNLKIYADREYKDIEYQVISGNAVIINGKLTANGEGPIMVRAYSASAPNVQGYCVLYAGKYLNALYDGYWTKCDGGISGKYWNPCLWNYDGYRITGWVVTPAGCYIPVIRKVEATTASGEKMDVLIISDLSDLLRNGCYGDMDALYRILYNRYLLLNKPSKSFEEMYEEALKEIADKVAKGYFDQLH